MADWKQITARIRRARTSKDPAVQLSNLFEKTRDAMVAFELAKFFETSGQNGDAAKWYTTAAERFRRADWKIKAQESAARLGGEISITAPALASTPPQGVDFVLTSPTITVLEPALPFEQNAAALGATVALSSKIQAATDESGTAPAAAGSPSGDLTRRRRGRRGGRNRRKGPAAKESTGAQSEPVAVPLVTGSNRAKIPAVSDEQDVPAPSRTSHGRAIPQMPIESTVDQGAPNVKGRYGDPGLSSRLSLLEMQFRRLLTCPPASLDDVDRAPVGPGVFVLSDSDLTSYYYVEPCQTLRIAVGNLLRGGSSRRGADSIKPQLAEHLGIPETRVAKYLAEHCAVRWLQLDEGASHFAHFVIAVLRPSLNQ